MQTKAAALLACLNCTMSQTARVRGIANAEQQMMEISKALS
jgi:ABC-type sugar transport system ATPase subunit